jgi:hypothetical protein
MPSSGSPLFGKSHLQPAGIQSPRDGEGYFHIYELLFFTSFVFLDNRWDYHPQKEKNHKSTERHHHFLSHVLILLFKMIVPLPPAGIFPAAEVGLQ